MKNIFYIITLSLLVWSCEDVIDVEVPNAAPKLVIDASLNWFDGTAGNEQNIILTLSAPYFNTEVPPANNAAVTVTDTNNNTFVFTEEGATGIYRTSNFIPEIDETYTLTITYNGETYTGTEVLKSTVPVNSIEQNNDGGFTGDEIEIKAFYTDPANIDNYYLFEVQNPALITPEFEAYKDEFVDGNEIFAFYSDEDLQAGDELIIRNYGVTERFYEFMFLLLQQTETDGGPFQTQPATVRGNCVNITNPDNFPLGYFRVSQAFEIIYTVE
jgi:hypothetical protein